MTTHIDGSKSIETKILDLYAQNGHYKHLESRYLACNKLVEYINCIDRAGELLDPLLLQMFFVVARQTYQQYREKYENK